MKRRLGILTVSGCCCYGCYSHWSNTRLEIVKTDPEIEGYEPCLICGNELPVIETTDRHLRNDKYYYEVRK